MRTKSLTLVRNLTEVMRAYPDAYVTGSGTGFSTASASATGAIPLVQAVAGIPEPESGDYSVSIDGTEISISGANNCLSAATVTDDGKEVPEQPCNINQIAARDTLLVKQIAAEEDLDLAVVSCPANTDQADIQRQMCVITAWNDTKAMLDNSDDDACANSNGVYKNGSQCLISEAY